MSIIQKIFSALNADEKQAVKTELAPEYRPFAFTKWNLGAAWVEVYEDGSFMVDNFRIIEDADGLYSIR